MITFSSPIEVAIFAIEIFGCVSFASSGAITALRKKADLLGVWVLTLISVFGGGLLRDLIISVCPPHIFWDPEYLWLAAISLIISTICFVVASTRKGAIFLEKHRHDFWIYALDAIGISVFCVSGAQVAYANLPSSIGVVETFIYTTALGVITGVCGGMFRDVFLGEIPMVFKKKFYMMPCVIGTSLFMAFILLKWGDSNGIVATIISCFVIIGLRILATVFQWNMPVAKAFNNVLEEEKEQNQNK